MGYLSYFPHKVSKQCYVLEEAFLVDLSFVADYPMGI